MDELDIVAVTLDDADEIEAAFDELVAVAEVTEDATELLDFTELVTEFATEFDKDDAELLATQVLI